MHDVQDLLDVHAEVPLANLKIAFALSALRRDRVSRPAPPSEPDPPAGALAPPRQRVNPIVRPKVSQGDLSSKQRRFPNCRVAFTPPGAAPRPCRGNRVELGALGRGRRDHYHLPDGSAAQPVPPAGTADPALQCGRGRVQLPRNLLKWPMFTTAGPLLRR
jgi:hypothetical protein